MISQTVEDGTMSAAFAMDMRTIGYSDMNTPIEITNNVTIADPQIPNGSANFEMALAQHSTVTAGRYSYAAGTKWDTVYGWESPGSTFGLGTYTYLNGESGFDPYTFNWSGMFDYSQNALSCARPSINDNKRNDWGAQGHGGGASCPGHP